MSPAVYYACGVFVGQPSVLKTAGFPQQLFLVQQRSVTFRNKVLKKNLYVIILFKRNDVGSLHVIFEPHAARDLSVYHSVFFEEAETAPANLNASHVRLLIFFRQRSAQKSELEYVIALCCLCGFPTDLE